MSDLIYMTDGYKLDHRRQYPPGTQFVMSNMTARSTRVPGQTHVVQFGLQYFLRRYLIDMAGEFFATPRRSVARDYQEFLDGYLGPNDVGVDHILALHDLGYIPLCFHALPEGTLTPLKVPMFTVENTLPEFYWVTNYFETLLSSAMWMGCTSATTAYRYRKLLDHYATKTGDTGFVDWQGHDFSFRGMASPEAAALSGAGHLLSFSGTDTLPSIKLLEHYYGGVFPAGSVPATEHSVMCAGGQDGELETYSRLLDLYPMGIVSVVSDTWDLWHVITDTLPKLKDKIMARDGKLVIRPDSGDPVEILCGDASAWKHAHGPTPPPKAKGVIQLLWDLFGGTVNKKGYKVLDSHIGAIYGDSITEERARDICARLEAKGFASTNVVLGIGSYTYQYVTRDTNGFAIKATAAIVNGVERQLFKNPVTDNGEKKSARGRLVVVKGSTGLELIDGLTPDEVHALDHVNLLQPVWSDGAFERYWSVDDVKRNLKTSDPT